MRAARRKNAALWLLPDAAFAAGCDDVLVNDCPDAAEFDRCCGEYLDRVTKDI